MGEINRRKLSEPPLDGLCTAKTKSGNKCRGAAIRGSNVCRLHGGSAPQVRRAAAERLLAATDPAAAELVRQINRGKSDPDRRAAAIAVLDRAGFKPTDVIELSGSVEMSLAKTLLARRERNKELPDTE